MWAQNLVTVPKSGSNLGAIVGGALGGVFGLILICLGLWWFVYRPKSKRRKADRDRESKPAQDPDFMGFYGDSEKSGGDEAWAKRELDGGDTVRGSIASRTELPSPPLPQYSPGSPGTPGSPYSNRQGSMEMPMSEMGDYWTARRVSRQTSPVELPTRRSMRFSGPHELPVLPPGARSPTLPEEREQDPGSPPHEDNNAVDPGRGDMNSPAAMRATVNAPFEWTLAENEEGGRPTS
jgi:hypothetical protein